MLLLLGHVVNRQTTCKCTHYVRAASANRTAYSKLWCHDSSAVWPIEMECHEVNEQNTFHVLRREYKCKTLVYPTQFCRQDPRNAKETSGTFTGWMLRLSSVSSLHLTGIHCLPACKISMLWLSSKPSSTLCSDRPFRKSTSMFPESTNYVDIFFFP